MSDQPTAVKIADIQVEDGHNPREDFAKKPIEELSASIKNKGIIQPLLVTPGEQPGKFKLIDGERRLRAAGLAKLKEVPVFVRENVNGDAVALALIANLQREDLDPIEQAKGFKRLMDEQGLNQKAVAGELNISPSLVSDRLGLLKLPDAAQGKIARGEVKLEHAKTLRDVAATSPEVADALATTVGDEPLIDYQAAFAAIQNVEGALVISRGSMSFDAVEHLLTDEQKASWRAAWPENSYDGPRLHTDEVIAAAKQYGCLVEIPYEQGMSSGTMVGFTDTDFIVGQIEQAIESAPKRAAKTAAEKSDKEREADRDQREKELADRAEAHAYNVEIGSKMREAFYSPEITVDRMRLIAIMVVESNDYRHLAAASIAFTDETLIEVKERGGIKLLGSRDAREQLIAHINVAKTAEEIMGILLYAIVGSQIANHESVPPSGRPVFTLPGEYGKAKPSVKLALEQALGVFKSGNTHKAIKARLDRMKGTSDDD